jgi:hypothetical protein
VSRIGFLNAASPAQFLDAAFREGLREAGFIVRVARRITQIRLCRRAESRARFKSAEGSTDQHPRLAAEFAAAKVNVIVALLTPSAHAAQQVTRDIPIV